MRVIQMTLDEDLVRQVDLVAKKLRTTRSAFTREALKGALRNFRTSQLERQHRLGYEKRPVQKTEFSVWEGEQEWGDQ